MDDRIKEAVDLFQEVMFYGTEKVIKGVDNPLWKEYSPEQMQMLKLIGKEGKITSSRLAILQSVHKSAISNRIKKLLQKDVIRIVQEDQQDRREKFIELTDKGKEILMKSDKAVTEYIENLLARNIEDEEIEQFLSFFRKLSHIIKMDGVE
ncbi:MarR family winged helix-turn-helix transcriptional regulator [Planococcus sp. 107-1]|uniref:MarR family winged helix-turn-helix transcriptional regulator n=1 Tax=Planococcus sp. 107-1 TaxID=2908840 RepID=UPI001F2F4281|nr:MarR family transcriptional regulator [Planococcus sp. 107-1]UJF27318.1 winged helix DNA-binding protein [Planococcus sp. 107-1]